MKNTEKFSKKVNEYIKYRPSYPMEFIEYLKASCGIDKSAVVADIGAGTGIFTKLVSSIAGKVYAVEPNDNMRGACIQYCQGIENIAYINGSAEFTKLDDSCLDFITVAQAFHWFDNENARNEFKRILKPEGKVVLVWNSRVPENDMVIENDEICRRYCPDFRGFSGGAKFEDESYLSLFKNGDFEYKVFSNDRLVTLEEFIGGSLSASYSPNVEDPNYDAFIEGLTKVFYKYSSGEKLLIPNNTHSYVGCI